HVERHCDARETIRLSRTQVGAREHNQPDHAEHRAPQQLVRQSLAGPKQNIARAGTEIDQVGGMCDHRGDGCFRLRRFVACDRIR
ncbi:MAG: hypothetical protein H6Q85_2830, partial [candidate division NC10 bacterium]|nr:hypothetical protein [candidate division NC10 bacterium]